MKKHLGKLKKMKTIDKTGPEFFPNENNKSDIESIKHPQKIDKSTIINCDDIRMSLMLNSQRENKKNQMLISKNIEKDSLEFKKGGITMPVLLPGQNHTHVQTQTQPMPSDKGVVYGSPAIWLKNIKRNTDQKEKLSTTIDSRSERSKSKNKRWPRKNNFPKFPSLNIENIDKCVKCNDKSFSPFRFKKKDTDNSGAVLVNLQLIHQKKNSANSKCENNFDGNNLKNSRNDIDNQIINSNTTNLNCDILTPLQLAQLGQESQQEKKITVWPKTASLNNFGGDDINTGINSLFISKSQYKNIVNNNLSKSILKTRNNAVKKFSNINHNSSKLMTTMDKDSSEIKPENRHAKKILLKNKIRKIRSPGLESALKDSLVETVNINNLRISQTNPNSEASGSSQSQNSDKSNNICNTGWKSDSGLTYHNSQIVSKSQSKYTVSRSENSNSNGNSTSNNSSSMFKTIDGKVQLDPYLNRTFNGKIKWKAGELIAEGSSSVIYKALNEDEGSIFVVKRINNISDKKLFETFQNEVKIFKQLDHPNIIKFLDSDIIENNLFIYLEYVSGGSIKYILDKYGPLNENITKIYLKQIIDGLEYLHSKQIVHRDIKCANILLDSKGGIKLSDFGCSGQFINAEMSSCENFLDSLKGTLPWMAPEVVIQSKYGKPADIWSLGCTLIEFATGNSPWGKLDNCYQAMTKIGRSNDIPEIPLNLSENFKDFLICCLKRNPKERATVKDLKNHRFLN